MGVATLLLYPHIPKPRSSELPWPSAPLLWQSSADAEAVVCSKACTVLNWRTVVCGWPGQPACARASRILKVLNPACEEGERKGLSPTLGLCDRLTVEEVQVQGQVPCRSDYA